MIRDFHGYPAPGMVIGVKMVSLAMEHLPKDILFDAISETSSCLPDAVQLLTLCTIGNSWLKIVDLTRYAVTLYDKYNGNGVRVFIDPEKLKAWPEFYTWLYKLRPKKEQDSDRLFDEIRTGGDQVLTVETVRVRPRYLVRHSKGEIGTCPLCGDAYPVAHGVICRGCQGQSPYQSSSPAPESAAEMPPVRAIPAEAVAGNRALHDMTRIIPGQEKGPAFTHGQEFTAGDVCRLQQMGRQRVYVADDSVHEGWVHENDVALAFAKNMAGEGVTFQTPPREGKITLEAARDGLLTVDVNRLAAFNMVEGVMCASRKGFEVVRRGEQLAATRAIPLFLSEPVFQTAKSVLADTPLFSVLPLRKAKVGVLVTGTEVFRGLIKDSFIPIIRSKVSPYGCEIVETGIVPDDRQAIRTGVEQMLRAGAELVITTAGLSVDPDDVTRQGLADAGCTEMIYGAPVLPGAMTLLAKIGDVRVMGVPACGLYHNITSFDLLLPRLLAGLEITRQDLAALGHGAFCRECKTCTFPKCAFGK
ncbi:trehalose-binding protein [Desulfonema ishimotonii]|uniref:Trehalose-binding protein n=2 Tax=Desulfonema ishimotonii TaxID=45657 RepID=A0A401FUY1_9BACT|nr:trehalose-binding protein [Desulfonema ishimotonii]